MYYPFAHFSVDSLNIIRARLEDMLEFKNINERYCVCANITSKIGALDAMQIEKEASKTAARYFGNIIGYAAQDWEHFSGNLLSPVPDNSTLWEEETLKWEGEQHELRISLMKHLIAKIDNALNMRVT